VSISSKCAIPRVGTSEIIDYTAAQKIALWIYSGTLQYNCIAKFRLVIRCSVCLSFVSVIQQVIEEIVSSARLEAIYKVQKQIPPIIVQYR